MTIIFSCLRFGVGVQVGAGISALPPAILVHSRVEETVPCLVVVVVVAAVLCQ